MENYFILGVDGGGTKTVSQIVDCRGNLISKGRSGSSNYKGVGKKNAINNINTAVISAIKKGKISQDIVFKSACFGLAGNDNKEDYKIYEKIIFNKKIKKHLFSQKTIICNDTRIGLAAGSDNKNGVMIICGTGSNCYGINESGSEASANGWDYILGDEGSGYTVGLKGLKAIARAYDGRGKDTFLSVEILKYLKLKNIHELVKWVYGKTDIKEKIAELARVVCSAAELQDEISMKILEEETKEASVTISTVVNKLELKDKDFDLVLVGSVFKCEKYFKNVLFKILKDKFPKINFKPLTKRPVEGAIKIALENI